MPIEEFFDERSVRIFYDTLLYSRIPLDHVGNTRFRAEVRAVYQQIFTIDGLDQHGLYGVTSEVVMNDEKRYWGLRFQKPDVLDYALPLDKKLNGHTNATFLSMVPTPEMEELDEESLEGRLGEFNKALDYLSKRLTPKEYKFLLRLTNKDQESVVRTFCISEEYVENNFSRIQQQLNLAMKINPEIVDGLEGELHQLDMETAIEPYTLGTYKEILMGTTKTFPQGFFTEDGQLRSRILTRFMAENLLQKENRVIKDVTREDFKENKLHGMLQRVHNDSPRRAIDGAYPALMKPWQNAERNYWTGEEGRQHAIEAIRWLIEERLGWKPNEAKKINVYHFRENNLIGMLEQMYNNSPSSAVMEAYAGMFKPWEFARCQQSYWKGEEGRQHAIEATKWLLEEKIKLALPVINIGKDIGKEHFVDNSLGGMLAKVYKGSISVAIIDAYPGRFIARGGKNGMHRRLVSIEHINS